MHGSVILRWASAERSGALGDPRLAGQPVHGNPLRCLTGDASCSSCWDEPCCQSGPHSVTPSAAVMCLTPVPVAAHHEDLLVRVVGHPGECDQPPSGDTAGSRRSLGDGGARLSSAASW
jgi:hypothetical protein